MGQYDDSSRGYRVNLKKGKKKSSDSGMATFRLFELTKFSFTPFSKVTKKYSFDRRTGKITQSIEDFVRANPYGRIEADKSKSNYISNKYVYVFERKQNSGKVELNCELKGTSDSKMEFEKYKPDRSKESTLTELSLPTILNGEYIQYYFILSGFRLTSGRIKIIAKQLVNSHGGAGFFTGAINMPRVATFTSFEYANYSPFNHIIFKEEQQFTGFVPQREDKKDDKKKFIVYLTDLNQLSFKIYNKFLEAYSCYLDWLTKQKDEKAQKQINISTIIEQLIKVKGSKATRHLSGAKKFDDIKIPFKLEPIKLQIDSTTTKAALELIFKPDLKKRLKRPNELFQLQERLSYSEWKERYDELSTFYYQTTLSWGLALLRVIMSDEYIHQVTDYVYGSYQGAGNKEYTIDDIETGKANKDGFDKEEGKAIYSNINGMLFSALSKFQGTAGFLKNSFETVFGVFDYIFTGNFDLEKLFEEPKNLTPKNVILAVFLGKKGTAGLAEFMDVFVTLNMEKVKKLMTKIQKGKLEAEANLNILSKLKKEYSNDIEMLKKYRKQNSANGKKLSRLQENTRTSFHRKKLRINQLNELNSYKKSLLKKEWKKVVLRELKEEIIEYVNDSFKLSLSLDDLKINEMGELVSINKPTASGDIRTLRSDHFVLVRETKAKIKSNSLHESLSQAEKDLKKGMKTAYQRTKEKASNDFKVQENFANKDYHDVYWETDKQRKKVKGAEERVDAQKSKVSDMGDSLKKNIEFKDKKTVSAEKWKKVSDGFTILNFVFESINLGFAIYDTIVNATNDELTTRDAIGLSGSLLDFTSSLVDVTTLMGKSKLMKIFIGLEKNPKLLRFGNFAGKFAAGIGVVSGVIDFYMDASQVKGNWKEGDSWGVLGNSISATGGLLTAVGSFLIITGGTGAVVIAVIAIGGIIAQIGGTLINNFLGSDQYELWLRHTCWGDEFGEKETTFGIVVGKPGWAVVDFNHWAYKRGTKEFKGKFGWAGRMDAQIDSFQNLVYYFGFSASASKDIYLSYTLEQSKNSGKLERKLHSPIKGGYIETTLSIPKMASPISCFIISIWLEDDSGNRKSYLLEDKKLLLVSKKRMNELVKKAMNEDSALYSRLKECNTGDEYLFGKIKKINKKSCVILKLIDEDIDGEKKFPTNISAGASSSYKISYQDFFDYEDGEVIRVKKLRDKLTSTKNSIYKNLVVSLQLDVYNNGRFLMPQYADLQIPKIIKLPLNEIGKAPVAMGKYINSTPTSYYYDMNGHRQVPGSIKDDI